VIDSAWGETDLIVMGEGNGTMAEDTLDRIKEVEGVRDAAGMVGGMFSRLEPDGSPIEGNTGQMLAPPGARSEAPRVYPRRARRAQGLSCSSPAAYRSLTLTRSGASVGQGEPGSRP
jgi:hypothetical protein